eukprot:scaffold442_cov268-Pinguiococcus_pyrenoidosus.AAC.37
MKTGPRPPWGQEYVSSDQRVRQLRQTSTSTQTNEYVNSDKDRVAGSVAFRPQPGPQQVRSKRGCRRRGQHTLERVPVRLFGGAFLRSEPYQPEGEQDPSRSVGCEKSCTEDLQRHSRCDAALPLVGQDAGGATQGDEDAHQHGAGAQRSTPVEHCGDGQDHRENGPSQVLAQPASSRAIRINGHRTPCSNAESEEG